MIINNYLTARELMEARYDAFTRGDIDFILGTHNPKTNEDLDVEETTKWARDSKWLGLEIIATEKGTETDDYGIVEFKATYEENGTVHVHHEKSEFMKVKGIWLYKGILPLQTTIVKGKKTGQNEPCPCTSGKKFKKCCGK
ncbi:MAG: YchJ family metal-binding protein [Fusobacteriaceae bacterium]